MRLVLIGAFCCAAGAGLFLATGDAGGEATAPSPPQTVKSKDGGLIVSVPRGALRKPAKVRIRVLQRSQYPPELRNATFRPGSMLYALEPAGLRFLKPVAVTRRIDAKLQGFDLDSAVPGIVLTTRSANGTWEILKGQTVRPSGKTLVISGTTRHFSTIVAFDGGARLTLIPPSIRLRVGERFEAKLEAKIDNRLRKDPVGLDEVTWTADLEVLDEVKDSGRNGATFQCAKPGSGAYVVKATLVEDSLAAIVFQAESYKEELFLTGRAACEKPPPTAAELVLAWVVVAHTPLGSFPSFTRWLLQLATANLPANAQAALTVTSVNSGQAMSQPVSTATGKVELVGGISSFGPKQVQRLTVGAQDVTQQLVAQVGATPTVTSSQGVIAGQCPP